MFVEDRPHHNLAPDSGSPVITRTNLGHPIKPQPGKGRACRTYPNEPRDEKFKANSGRTCRDPRCW
jgi:hypothetical protein